MPEIEEAQEILEAFGMPKAQHDKLSDVVLYDAERNWLFLVEAVTLHDLWQEYKQSKRNEA